MTFDIRTLSRPRRFSSLLAALLASGALMAGCDRGRDTPADSGTAPPPASAPGGTSGTGGSAPGSGSR